MAWLQDGPARTVWRCSIARASPLKCFRCFWLHGSSPYGRVVEQASEVRSSEPDRVSDVL